MRPEQWLKNLFVFLPLFFSRHFVDPYRLPIAVLVFFCFCFIASSVYCFNDIIDVASDRLHPEKSKRPIASGSLSVRGGYLMMAVLFVLSVLLLLLLPDESRWKTAGILLAYYVMNIAYSLKLKRIVLVDVFVIATGFVLRILAGGVSSGIWVSHWIVLVTFQLALFLALAKRRDDVAIYRQTGNKPRTNIQSYNLAFIDQALGITASVTIVCYIMYTLSDEVIARMGTPYLYLTSIFVLAGIVRYLQLTIVERKSGSPTRVLLQDRFIQICAVAWIVSFSFIIYI